MKLIPIVEGHGDIEAVPILLRRLAYEHADAAAIEVETALRLQRGRIVMRDPLQRMVTLAKREGAHAIMILFDSDDDCPVTLATKVAGWATEAAIDTPCATVVAHREFEAWFLASIESLRGKRGIRDDAELHSDPEQLRDAKGALKERMRKGRGYSEATDQPAFAATFSMSETYVKCRSFRKFVKAFGDLIVAAGEPVSEWPPASLAGDH